MSLIRLFALTVLVFLASVAAHGDVDLAPPVSVSAAGYQSQSAVATDGRDFLAVWTDTRIGVTAIYGTRIRADGTVLDPFGILIARRGEQPAVAWDGSQYVVVWENYEGLFAAPVSRDGQAGERISLGFLTLPSIASNGKGSMIAARARSGMLWLASLSQTLNVVSGNGGGTFSMLGGPQIAPLGDGYFVAWNEFHSREYSVHGTRVSDASSISIPAGSLLAAGGSGVRLAAHDGRILMTYTRPELSKGDFAPPLPHSIEGRFILSDTVTDSFSIVDTEEKVVGDVSIAGDGERFSVVWMKKVGDVDMRIATIFGSPFRPTYDLQRTIVDLSGTVLGDESFVVGSDSDEQPAITSNGATLLVTWSRIRWSSVSGYQKIGSAITSRGGPAEPIEVAKSASHQQTPKVAWAGDRYVVVWGENANSDHNRRIYARSVGVSGRFFDPKPIPISAGEGNHFNPAVACDDDICLAVWQERVEFRTVGRRFRKTGELMDTEPLVFSQTAAYLETAPAVASGGSHFAVFYRDTDLAVAYVDRDGEVARESLFPAESSFGVYPLSLAWDGESFVAAWSRIDGTWNVEAARLTPGKTFSRSEIVPIAHSEAIEVWPSVACLDGDCIVSWQESGTGIGAARFSKGVKIPIRPRDAIVENILGGQARANVVQERFLIAWRQVVDGELEIRAALVTRDGALDLVDTSVLANIRFVAAYDVAIGEGNQLAVVYAAPRLEAPYAGANRVMLRLVPAQGERRRAIRR